MKTHPTIKRVFAPAIAVVLGSTFLATSPAHAGERQGELKQVEQVKPESDWEFQLALPAWAPAISGDIGVNRRSTHAFLSAGDFVRDLDMAAVLSAEVRKGRIGIYGDLVYANLSDGVDPGGLLSKVDLRLDEYIADLELFYRVLEGPRGFIDVRAGVRPCSSTLGSVDGLCSRCGRFGFPVNRL